MSVQKSTAGFYDRMAERLFGWVIRYPDNRVARQVPNMMVALRTILVPIIGIWALLPALQAQQTGSAALWLLLIVLLIATDAVDGPIARKMNAVSRFGDLGDPVGDKASALTLIYVYWVATNPLLAPEQLEVMHVVLLVAIVLEALLVVAAIIGGLLGAKPQRANDYGKFKFNVQCGALAIAMIGLIVSFAFFPAAAISAAICTVGIGYAAIYAGRSLWQHAADAMAA